MLSLTTYRRPVTALSDWIDNFLSSEFRDAWPNRAVENWSPRVDIVEEKDAYKLHADLPGMNKEDIKISVEGGVLSITGERKSETRDRKEGNYEYFERTCGSFCRSFNLPDHVDSSRIKAGYHNGVLELELPKTEQAKPRQIEVKVD
jgi:HSP20 family protein